MRAASAITMPQFHAKLVTRSIVITIHFMPSATRLSQAAQHPAR
jgi:hypothetical protein